VHDRNVVKVLLGHAGQRDRGDIEFALPNQVEQQVERAVEDIERDP
jgi:hypothetical protein